MLVSKLGASNSQNAAAVLKATDY